MGTGTATSGMATSAPAAAGGAIGMGAGLGADQEEGNPYHVAIVHISSYTELL